MREKHRLNDVLKLKANNKWAIFNTINSSEDDSLLQPISMANKSDATSISQLTKLIAAEQKKMNYEHVVTLTRTIRRYFMDEKKVFRAMVDNGLDKVILTSISELRRKATQAGISGQAPVLRSLLTNVSDMFEWEFFGKNIYRPFIEEMLAVLTGCNDCDDSLFAQAASVIMSMCTTNISRVSDCFLQSKASTSRLETVLRDLPRAKSFHYEALLLELIYRLHRHSKRHGNEKMSLFIAKVIKAFPMQIARTLTQISPKVFRDETRRILNDFNTQVGVIKSLSLRGLSLSGPKLSKTPIKPAGWIDFGGTILEIEATILADGLETITTIKLPYKKIDSVTSSKSNQQVLVTVNDAVHLSDIMDGDPMIANSTSLRICLSFDTETCSEAIEVLEQRKESRVLEESITVVSSTMQSETKGYGSDSERLSTDVERPSTEYSAHLDCETKKPAEEASQPKKSAETIPREFQPSTDAEVELDYSEPNMDLKSSATSKTKKTSRHKHLSPNAAVGHAQTSDKRNTLLKKQTKKISPTNQALGTNKAGQSSTTIVPHEDEVRDEHDQRAATQDQADTNTQKFRLRQTQQLHQLQSLVAEIVETNDQFRQFNIASACRELVGDSDRQIKRKRERWDGVDAFESANAVVRDSVTKRAQDGLRRKDFQHGMRDAISSISTTEAEINARAENLLATIQKKLESESRQSLGRVQKKLRTQACQCVKQTKEKILAIEKAFNTDDLQMMQHMLQRI